MDRTNERTSESTALVEFEAPLPENRQPRCPCVLVLDSSGSMNGQPINKLNDALAGFPGEMQSDQLAIKRVEVAIVGFPPVEIIQPFTTMDGFAPPRLVANGGTPLGAAVIHGLRAIEDRKAYYRENHLEWFRPWLFLVTDGEPDRADDWRAAAAATRRAEDENKVTFFAVGVPGADMKVLAEFSRRRPPIELDKLRFREMIQWLSRSMRVVSQSSTHTGGNPNSQISLPPPSGWGRI